VRDPTNIPSIRASGGAAAALTGAGRSPALRTRVSGGVQWSKPVEAHLKYPSSTTRNEVRTRPQ
jgi:hypothetical protein